MSQVAPHTLTADLWPTYSPQHWDRQITLLVLKRPELHLHWLTVDAFEFVYTAEVPKALAQLEERYEALQGTIWENRQAHRLMRLAEQAATSPTPTPEHAFCRYLAQRVLQSAQVLQRVLTQRGVPQYYVRML